MEEKEVGASTGCGCVYEEEQECNNGTKHGVKFGDNGGEMKGLG